MPSELQIMFSFKGGNDKNIKISVLQKRASPGKFITSAKSGVLDFMISWCPFVIRI